MKGHQDGAAPLSPEQEELWLSLQLGGTPANLAYHQAYALTLRGVLDTGALLRGLDTLQQRHEALRTTLHTDGERLRIAPAGQMPLERRDLSELEPEARERELAIARRTAVTRELDPVAGPLARAVLLRTSEREHVLILVAHHLICDGTSWSILLNELAELYSAERRGTPANLPEPTPFGEYAAERVREARSESAETDLAYWRDRFASVPPPLDLPLDHPRPPTRTFDGDRLDVALPAALTRDLRSIAGRHRTSLATLLLAAFQAYLQRLSGQRSFTTIVPAAGQAITGQQALVGHCVRTLPLRADIDPAQTFTEHLSRVQASLLDALDHPRISFGRLLKALPLTRDPGRVPLAPVAVSVDTNPEQVPFDGLDVEIEFVPRSYESFEWFLNFNVGAETIVMELCYGTRLFDRRSIEERLEGLTALLEDVARGPEKRLSELAIMTERQRRQVLVDFNRTDAERPDRTLCAAFREQARRSPQRTAVRSGGRSLSYAELDRASSALAAELVARGAGEGTYVGVFLSRSVDLSVATLGILRAGAAYVPLDPDYPSERLEFIASDTRLAAVVSEPTLASRLPQSCPLLLVDAARAGAAPDLDASRLSAPAYVIYTSGSTGRPKGVVIEHQQVANVLRSMARRPGLSASDVMVCVASPCFDMSVPDFFLPLTVGAELVIATHDELIDGQRLGQLLAEHGATLMQATPAGWRVLLESGWQGLGTLRAVCAGEVMPSQLALELSGRVQELWNGYGPTEATVYTTFERVSVLPAAIGTPVDNARVYVLDESGQPVPPGVTGELYVGGAGIARGYHQRPELTAQRFLHDPFAAGENPRLYRTGDLARFRWDGKLDWLGRNDSQVKVRGFRIELGEVEARVAECEGVRDGVVTVREDRPGDQRLVAYVRAEPGAELSEASIRARLRSCLPAYMVPHHVVVVPRFPLNPNGKVDRKALPPPEGASEASYREPRTELETIVAAHFAELVGVPRAGLDDDFFALGGHSLLALRLVARLLAVTGTEVPVRAVFATPTVQGIADYIDAARLAQRGSGVRTIDGAAEREERIL